MATPTGVVRSAIDSFIDGIVDALPELAAGLIFLALAYLGIRVIRTLLRASLSRAYPSDQRLVVDFIVIVATVFLWFGAALLFLDLVGMGAIAASLGTAAGFIALGISYALSEMIEDTVAGIYLLKDPDFNPGDRVTAASITGTVTEIGLRKSRFELDDGDVVVVANRDVESKWTKQADEATAP
jgi:small-conductance mechanosensitive channel